MFPTPALFIVAGLTVLQGVHAQLTTATLLPGLPDVGQPFQGEILGTGAGETTYAISEVISGTPLTATLVEDATHLSENVAVSTAGALVDTNSDCSLNENHEGACSVIVSFSSGSVQAVTSAVLSASFSEHTVELKTSSSSSDVALSRAASFFAFIPLISLGLVFW
ncbi:uncharacterized protein FOMMEDRAFT_165527 [Fomitiporia mediterranea MF3/22]|uniref:uncharacterized protein n=1 Tax=Fomitiporia mediterranea (strain MF3/22) TaxID=694068 RepID=UPI0004407443|nr:uncharacterized protein FOMMEDRAFT_165527 [Fomitiporia mediterranea MF3/22]EJD06843.1 hypothetical protein FOMMEDRAFT_165527 [Fomitiporia mediterranea MF3/22]